MIRAVLDTNVLISALLQSLGSPAQVFLATLKGSSVQLCVSGDIYAEYDEVIRRPKFQRSENEIANTLRVIRERGVWVKATERVRVCSDPDDDIFLECAQAARAHYLVTGNTKDFPEKWLDTQVVTARQFLDAMAEMPEET